MSVVYFTNFLRFYSILEYTVEALFVTAFIQISFSVYPIQKCFPLHEENYKLSLAATMVAEPSLYSHSKMISYEWWKLIILTSFVPGEYIWTDKSFIPCV